MEEIVKHINDTNASYRALGAGDAKNTDLFLDNEHYELFRNSGEQITVRFNKENLTKAILFIASILPRKYDNSAIHRQIPFSEAFVYDQLTFLDGFFTVGGVKVESRTQIWTARKDVLKKNGEVDNRFYFNGLLEDVSYTSFSGIVKSAKFTIRNYLAGGYSDLHIRKSKNGIFDVWITNALEPYDDGKEKGLEIIDTEKSPSVQQIFYGAPGTGKSNTIKRDVDDKHKTNYRVTFHPDSDYSTFVGCYKPTMKENIISKNGVESKEEQIVYRFVPQAFTKAYTAAWNTEDEVYLIIEEINRGNCAQIFGDLFQLLDRKNGVSEYPVDADSDLADYIYKNLKNSSRTDFPEGVKEGKKLVLPSNLFIWATMNTSDQSLFPIDSAFKRRWDWRYIPIAQGRNEDGTEKRWEIEGQGENSWWTFIQGINEVIDVTTHSEDKKLGFFFCKAQDGVVKKETFVNKVVFYLWNDVFKVYGFKSEIFDKKGKDDKTEKITFKSFYNGDGSVNEETMSVFVKNVMAKASKESTDSENLDVSGDDDTQS